MVISTVDQKSIHCQKRRYHTEPLRLRAVLRNYFKFRDTEMVRLYPFGTILSSGNLRRFRNLTAKPTGGFVAHIQNLQWFRVI